MSGGSYRPLGGHSPSLQPQPSYEQSDITDTEMLSLDRDGYGRPPSPPEAKVYTTDYNNFRYGGGGYPDPTADIEAEGLIRNDEKFPQTYRMYKRRWFGLAVLTVHSFAIGWGFNAPGVLAQTATKWFDVSLETLDDLSVAGNLVFLIPAPFIIWTLNRLGPKWSMVISIVFTAIGNWIIYIGTAKHNFDINVAGTVIHSMASGFSLCAPTRYSRLWFNDKSRTLATALPSLAYLLGAGFGAVTGPFMVQPIGKLTYSQQALIIAIIFTAVGTPAFFIPSKPPTPPSAVATMQNQLSAKQSVLTLLKNKAFYLQLITFAILAGAIETTANVSVQILLPYGYTQQQAANAIAILVFVGIAAALIVSPILDRTKQHENAIRIFAVIIAIAYTGLPWVPDSHSTIPLYIVFAIIGACSISLEPAVLEYQASRIHPVSPEYATVLTFSACKAMIALLVTLVGKVMPMRKAAEGQPVQSLFNGLLLLAGLAWVVVVCSFLNGRWIFKRTEGSMVEGND